MMVSDKNKTKIPFINGNLSAILEMACCLQMPGILPLEMQDGGKVKD